jgi:hypothetical protein
MRYESVLKKGVAVCWKVFVHRYNGSKHSFLEANWPECKAASHFLPLPPSTAHRKA